MPEHEEKYCPRCHSAFECKAGSIMLCQCSTVKLKPEELEFIQSRFEDCLCANCMKELKAEYQNQKLQDTMKRILGIFYKPPKYEK